MPGGVNRNFIFICIWKDLGLEKCFLFLSSVLGREQGGEQDMYQNSNFVLLKVCFQKNTHYFWLCLRFQTQVEVKELNVLLLQADESVKQTNTVLSLLKQREKGEQMLNYCLQF